MKTISLIVGGTGFLSKPLINHLSPGETLTISLRENCFQSAISLLNNFKDCRVTVFFAAWPTSLGYDNFGHIEYWMFIVKPFIEWLNLNLTNFRLVTFGTCLEYGYYSGELSVTNVCAPCTKLGAAKLMMYSFCRDNISNYKHLRIFYPYCFDNPRSGTLLHHLKKAVDNSEKEFDMSIGSQERDFISVSDCTKQILDIAFDLNDSRILFNIASGKPTSVVSLVKDYLSYHKYSLRLNLGIINVPWYEPFSFYSSMTSLFT